MEAVTHDVLFKDAVMLRTYCRDRGGRKEFPHEVWNRVIGAFEKYYHREIRSIPYFHKHAWDDKLRWQDDWFIRMSTGKALPAGRMLWAMGSTTVNEVGYLPLMNCAFKTINSPVEPLIFIANMLMLGCGVGFSLEKKFFDAVVFQFRLARMYAKETDPIIEEKFENGLGYFVYDSRKGWINFLKELMTRALFYEPFTFNLMNIRPAGSVIHGFGGRSGDPRMLAKIGIRIYNLLVSKKVPDIEMYYDVICSIGELVVSGNVRRSALIAIGDPDDQLFLGLKRFDTLGDKPWRCFCNNSVNVSTFGQLSDAYWSTYTGDSEAYGWVNIEKCRKSDKLGYIQPVGFNPCGEQPLADMEVCCLGEVNLSRAESPEDLMESMIMCYFFCKFAMTMWCDNREIDAVVKHNMRMGISLTGVAMVDDEKREWAYTARKKIRVFDEIISDLLGINRSVALTTIKPGGTLPKIAGSSGPGIHRPFSKYQIRRVRFHKRSSLLKWIAEMGIPIEPQYTFGGEPDPSGTMVASFYLKNETPADGHFADWQLTEEGFKETIRLVAEVQDQWSDNAISVTVYYDKSKVDTLVKPLLGEYFEKLKVFSGLPYYGHNFAQAPEEPIAERDYNYYVTNNPIKDYQICVEIDDDASDDLGQCESRGGCSDR